MSSKKELNARVQHLEAAAVGWQKRYQSADAAWRYTLQERNTARRLAESYRKALRWSPAWHVRNAIAHALEGWRKWKGRQTQG